MKSLYGSGGQYRKYANREEEEKCGHLIHLKSSFSRLKSEVSETEERKNAQIEQMKRKHEKAFNDIKNYYNDITLNNLAMIR